MLVKGLTLGPLQTNCWIVGDDSRGPVAVIDPADSASAILHEVGDRSISAIVLTHCHFDHLGAARELVRTTGASLAVHELDAASVTNATGTGGAFMGFSATAPEPSVSLRHGDRIAAGDLELQVLHTPGHTPGGICLLVSDAATGETQLFSGDTLFFGSVGRTDFPGGDARALSRSIALELAPLPASVVVHPGHGPDTTIGREARVNPFWPRG